jgi:hypothetical protein
MQPRHLIINFRWAARLLAWSALAAAAILLAFLLQSLAASALVAPRSATPPAACQSPAGAALADGDDVRMRFLVEFCGPAIAPHPSR